MIMTSSTALFSVVLALTCMVLGVSGSSDLVVLTTADRLREEIRGQLDQALAEEIPKLCTCGFGGTFPPPVRNTSTVTETNNQVLNVSRVEEAVTETVNDLLAPLISKLSDLMTPGLTPSHPATSCKEILKLTPNSPSGLYWISGRDDAVMHMYCDMERSCKDVGGGWMRVASINMTDSSSTCPSGLKTLESPIRRCAMNINDAGCSSAVFQVQGVQYSQV